MKKIELNILIFIIIEALFLLYGFKINLINIFLGTILGVILIKIINKFKKNKIIALILLIITIIFFIVTVLNICFFITNNILNNYSNFFIIISILIINYLLIKNNYHSFIKTVQISFYFILIIKIISFLLVIPNLNFNNINSNLIKELNINISTPIIGLVVCYINLLIYYLSNHKLNNKVYLISSINPIVIKMICILTMGRTLTYLYNYPYIKVLQKIKYLDFIERMEGILSFQYLFDFFIFSGLLLLFFKCHCQHL